jgi:hypothetical protein
MHEDDFLLAEHRAQRRSLGLRGGVGWQSHFAVAVHAVDRHLVPVGREEARVILHHAFHATDDGGGRKVNQGNPHGAGDASIWGMRILSLIVVVAIVYLVYGRTGENQSVQSRVAEAQREAALVQPASPSATPPVVSGSLRGPIDKARRTLELVKPRNTE